jgi:flagellar biosynthesis protein FliQ
LRARPEQTQLEDLSDASFLGKLLVLPANVTLDWKVIARYKHSSLFGLIISNEDKKFYNIDTWSTFRMSIKMPFAGAATFHQCQHLRWQHLQRQLPQLQVNNILFSKELEHLSMPTTLALVFICGLCVSMFQLYSQILDTELNILVLTNTINTSVLITTIKAIIFSKQFHHLSPSTSLGLVLYLGSPVGMLQPYTQILENGLNFLVLTNTINTAVSITTIKAALFFQKN